MAENTNTNTDEHRPPQPQLVTSALLRAELAELELRMVDRIGDRISALEARLENMNGRLWFAFSILAALIVGFGIFG